MNDRSSIVPSPALCVCVPASARLGGVWFSKNGIWSGPERSVESRSRYSAVRFRKPPPTPSPPFSDANSVSPSLTLRPVGCEVRAVLAPARRHLAALVRVLQHDVDHAGDRIRAVLRAGAVAQHLDALDRADRNAVEVDRARALAELGFGRQRRSRVAPLAVHEHQHLVRAQVPQLRGTHDVREVRVRLARQVERRHQRLDRGADLARDRGRLPDRLGRDEVDRREALVDVVAGGARADDDDLLELGRSLLCRVPPGSPPSRHPRAPSTAFTANRNSIRMTLTPAPIVTRIECRGGAKRRSTPNLDAPLGSGTDAVFWAKFFWLIASDTLSRLFR